MARGSEPAVRWKDHPGVERVCAACRRPLRIADVGRVHSVVSYAAGTGTASSTFYCIACRHEGYGS